jgi:hypothetical protein
MEVIHYDVRERWVMRECVPIKVNVANTVTKPLSKEKSGAANTCGVHRLSQWRESCSRGSGTSNDERE